MATGPAIVSGRDTLETARQRVLTSDFFGLCYLMLCNLAYTDEDDAQQAIRQINQLLPNMPVPGATVQGKWVLGWGPQASLDNSNLMYAAELEDLTSGQPVFSAVVIRGTDTRSKPSGILRQLVEDLNAEVQVTFPENNSAGSKIALGSKLGLDVLKSFVDSNGSTVEQYLNDFVHRSPAAPIVVTGHSLGGCQTTVLGLDLISRLPGGAKMVPNSFAAPTAGNSAFITLYERTFAYAPRWFNEMDLVPMAFAGLDGIKQLWSQCNRPAPRALKVVLDGFEALLKTANVTYSQQSPANSRTLANLCQPDTGVDPRVGDLSQAVAEIQLVLQRQAQKLHIPTPSFLFEGIDNWVRELLFQHLIPTGYWQSVGNATGVAPISNPFL
jgi:hypothetical protein